MVLLLGPGDHVRSMSCQRDGVAYHDGVLWQVYNENGVLKGSGSLTFKCLAGAALCLTEEVFFSEPLRRLQVSSGPLARL